MAFILGENVNLIFGILGTVEKVAQIAVKVRSMGRKKQSIESNYFKVLANEFGVEMDKKLSGYMILNMTI